MSLYGETLFKLPISFISYSKTSILVLFLYYWYFDDDGEKPSPSCCPSGGDLALILFYR